MIYLITGLPGDGKTNFAVGLVKARAEKEKRPVYYNASPDGDPEKGGMVILDAVALPWIPIDPLEWYNAPEGAIIFIDECQHYFSPRKRGDAQPEFAQRLENHRKAGHDIYLLTQHPSLIDSHERKLVEQHIHTVRKFGSSWVTRYTWKGARDQPQLAAARKDATEAQALLNKQAFKWYLSTKVNTSKVKVPGKVIALVLLIIGLPLGGWYWLHKQEQRITNPGGVARPSSSSVAAGGDGGSGGQARKVTPAEYVAEYQARVAGLAYTAPAYDKVTQPVQAPYPAACVQMGPRCQCYTQQGTKLETSDFICRGVVDGGFFVAWQSPMPLGDQTRPLGAPVHAGQVNALAGSFSPSPAPIAPPAVDGEPVGRGKALPRLPQPSNAPS